MKTLQLSLKKKWFDMTKPGIKPEDYRAITPYWVKRLTQCTSNFEHAAEELLKGKAYIEDYYKYCNIKDDYCFPKHFDINIMTLGYPSKNDTERIVSFKHDGIEVREGNPEWGAVPGVNYFVVKHGERIKPLVDHI